MAFNQIIDHKHDIILVWKYVISTKLFAEAANKNTKFMFTKSGRFKYGFRSDCLEKFQTNISVG